MCVACEMCAVCVVCAVCAVFAVLIVCIVQCESMVYQVPAGGKPEPSCPVAASCCRYCTGQWSCQGKYDGLRWIEVEGWWPI